MTEFGELMDWLDAHGGDARHTDRWRVRVGGIETASRNLVKALQEAKEKLEKTSHEKEITELAL